MKKLVTFILVLCLVLGMGTVALAEGYDDNGLEPIYKNLTLANEDRKPGRNFTFKIGAGTGERDELAPEFN